MTERVGLLGWPVSHSISPAMHNAAFAALGLDWEYNLLPVPPEDLEAALPRLIADGYRGFNVTIPHKQAVVSHPLITQQSAAVKEIGAANTLLLQPDGTWWAENTDWLGFAHDLRENQVMVQDQNCLVLGTGGSSRAVIYALDQLGAKSVKAVSRTARNTPRLINYAQLVDQTLHVDLVINCTPVGMFPNEGHSPWPDDLAFPPNAILYDLIYNPSVTRLMQQAQAAGARAVTGLGMLVRQGALAFEMWTGHIPPLDTMFSAAQSALQLSS